MSSTGLHAFVATAPQGCTDLTARELSALGASDVRAQVTSVGFTGRLEIGYRACLWSRTASRVLLELTQFDAGSVADFYSQLCGFEWEQHIDPDRSIACAFTGTHPDISNTHFGALRLKDAICDHLRAVTGRRPDVSRARPAIRVHAHSRGTHITLLLDMAGEGLHRRGYRTQRGPAPLRENVAAAVLLRARWDEAAERGAEFLDPLCGSGTLVIEAAMIAAARAPGLAREYWGFCGWRRHDAALWQRLCEQAAAAARASVGSIVRGSDIDAHAVALAAANAERAGVASLVSWDHQLLETVRPRTPDGGLICTNPPYGERLGDTATAQRVHAELGRTLREHFAGWDAAVLTTTPELARELRLRSYRTHRLWNGALACRLLRVDLSAPGAVDLQCARQQQAAQASASAGAQMFANRLHKNIKRLQRLARRLDVTCYRLYDADMPEYAFAIDRYLDADSDALHLSVQEYAAPADINEQAARHRRREVLSSLPQALGVTPERIHLRLRQRQRGSAQYSARRGLEPPRRHRLAVREGGLRFWVNLNDYLDTGLFLDQRLTRARLRQRAAGTRLLNLFCYTASASVYAAAGGAAESLSVDLSPRYMEWAADNFRLNGLDLERHRLLCADCRTWLPSAAEDAARRALQPFSLIFLDPPTFSNSKRMRGVLDLQRDHPQLIDWCMRLLAPGGLLLFSTNAQRFRLATQIEQRYQVHDISKATLPFDFLRHPRIHRCFEICARGSEG